MSDFKLVDPVDLDDEERMRIVGELNAKNKITPQLPITGVASPEIRTPITPILEQQYLKANALGASATLSKNITPSKAAINTNLSHKTGIPLPLYWDNDELTKQSEELHREQLASRNDWYQASIDYPALTRGVTDPTIFSLSSDDHENLSWLESQWQQFKNGWEVSKAQQKLSQLGHKLMTQVQLTGKIDHSHDYDVNQLQEIIRKNSRTGINLLYDTSSILAPMIEAGKEALVQGGIKGVAFGAAAGVGTLIGTRNPQTAMQVARIGFGAGSKVGGALGAFNTTAMQSSGQFYIDNINLKTKSGKPIDPMLVANTAALQGDAVGALETAGDILTGFIVGKVGLKAMRNVLAKNPSFKGLVDVIDKNANKLAELPKDKVLLEVGKMYLKVVASETFPEIVQNVVTDVGAKDVLQAQTNEAIDQPSTLSRVGGVIAGIPQIISAVSILGAGSAGVHVMNVRAELNKAKQYKESFLNTVEAINKSTTDKRDPVTAGQIFQDIANNNGAGKVYFDKEQVAQTINKLIDDHIETTGQEIDKATASSQLGLDLLYQKINNADENSDHLEFDLSDLKESAKSIKETSGIDIYSQFQDDVTNDPSQPTVRQAMDIDEQFHNEWLDEINKYKDQELAIKQQVSDEQEVYNNVYDRLINLDREVNQKTKKTVSEKQHEQKSRVNAKIFQSMIIQESARSGLPIKQIAEQLIPDIYTPKTVFIKKTKAQVAKELQLEIDEDVVTKIKKSLGKTSKLYIEPKTLSDWREALGQSNIPFTTTANEGISADSIAQEIFPDGISMNDFVAAVESSKKWTNKKIQEEIDYRINQESEYELQGFKYTEQLQREDILGFLDFNSVPKVIGLTSKRNATTFLHETAHIFLRHKFEVVKKNLAGEEYLKDWGYLSEWLQIKEDQSTLTTEQEEQFAKGFEAYLKRGEAPSIQLKRIFGQLRKWFTDVYKAIILPADMRILERAGWIIEPRIQDGVKVSPEVRDVFDRMLASDIEIVQAKKNIGLDKIINKIESLGFADNVIENLKRLQESGDEYAVQKLIEQQLKEIDAEYVSRKESIRKSIEEKKRLEIDQEPLRVVAKKFSDDYGYSLEELKSKILSGDLDPVRTDFEARSMGYESDGEMFFDILELESHDVELENRVQNEMVEKYGEYGDIRKSVNFLDIATGALHNNEMLNFLSAEYTALNEDTKNINLAKAHLEKQKAKLIAEKYFANTKISDLKNPSYYYTIERNAAIKAAEYATKKDVQKAAEWKIKQIRASAVTRQAIKLKEQANKNYAYLNEIAKTPSSKEKHYFKNQEIAGQISKILMRFGFDPKFKDKYIASKTINEWADENKDWTILHLSPFILNVENKSDSHNDLTIDQSNDVVNAIKNIRKLSNAEYNFLTAWDKGVKEVVINNLIVEATAAKNNVPRKQYESNKKSLSRAFQSLSDSFRGANLNVSRLLTLLDGLKPLGSWRETFYETMKDATAKKSKMMYDAIVKHQEIANIIDKKEFKSWEKSKYIPELGDNLTHKDLVCMALNWGTESNRQRLTEGRDIDVFNPETGMFEKKPKRTQEDIWTVLDRELTEKDWEFVKASWDFIGGYWKDITNLYLDLTGFAPERVKGVQFKTRFGWVEGKYYPLAADYGSTAMNAQEKAKELALEAGHIAKAQTKNGFIEKRSEHAQYPVLLDFDLPLKHVTDVIHDLSFRKAIIDINSLMRNKSVIDNITRFYGSKAVDQINKWASIIARNGRAENQENGDAIIRGLRKRATVSIIFANIGNTIQNLAGFFQTGHVDKNYTPLDAIKAASNVPVYLKESLKYTASEIRNDIAEICNKTLSDEKYYNEIYDFVTNKEPELKLRFINRDRDFLDVANNVYKNDNAMIQFSASINSYTDRLVVMTTYYNAYHKGLQLYGHLSEKQQERKARQYGMMVVRDSIGSGLPEDLAQIMQGGEFKKLLTTFMSYAQNQLQLKYMAFKRTQFSETKIDFAKNLAGLFALAVIYPLVSELAAIRPPEDDEELKWVAKAIAKDNSGGIMIGRDAVNLAINLLEKKQNRGFASSPGLSGAELMVRGVVAPFTDGLEKQKTYEQMTKGLAVAVPYPNQFNSWTWNMVDILQGEIDPSMMALVRRQY